MFQLSKRRIAEIVTKDDGTVSVEFAVWLPLLFSLGIVITDVSAAFVTQASMWQAAGETARNVATGRMTMDQARQRYANNSSFTIDVARSGTLISVQASVPYGQIGSGTLLAPLGTMSVQIQQIAEPTVF